MAFCLAMVGCGKDSEVNEFIAENTAVIKDITAKIDANPMAADGAAVTKFQKLMTDYTETFK